MALATIITLQKLFGAHNCTNKSSTPLNLKGVFIYELIQRAKPSSADNTLLFKMASIWKEEQV